MTAWVKIPSLFAEARHPLDGLKFEGISLPVILATF